jgi:hypothetical protein
LQDAPRRRDRVLTSPGVAAYNPADFADIQKRAIDEMKHGERLIGPEVPKMLGNDHHAGE